jgi:hypothetical protein
MALLHPNRRKLFVYNHSAHLIWRSMTSPAAICLPKVLESRFGLAREQAERDVSAILSNWVDHGLAANGACDLDESAASSLSAPEPAKVASPRALSLYRFGRLVVGLSAERAIEDAIAPLLAHVRVADAEPELVCVIGASGGNRYFLAADGRVTLDDIEAHVAIGAFFQTVIERLHAGMRFQAFVHAAAVTKDGRAVIFPAASGSGKSTLTAYLVARGFQYSSDDLVPLAFENDGVAPFPLPLSVKPGAAKVLARYFPAIDPGKRDAPQHLVFEAAFSAPFAQAKAIVFPRYSAESPTQFTQISVAEAFARLLSDRIFFGYPIDLAAVRGVIGLLGRVHRYELIYSDLEEAERCVSKVLTT